jgi:hypothetical protein
LESEIYQARSVKQGEKGTNTPPTPKRQQKRQAAYAKMRDAGRFAIEKQEKVRAVEERHEKVRGKDDW